MIRLTPLFTAAAVLAMASAAQAQNAAAALVNRPPEAQRDMIAEVIAINTGEPAEIRGLWGYALSERALIYCGYRRDALYRNSGFAIVMNGVDRDTVVTNMSAESLTEIGCAQPHFRPLVGVLLPSNPLGGVNIEVSPPRSTEPPVETIRFPVERANEPACVAGRQIAYRAVILDDVSVLDGIAPEVLRDRTDLFGLCFNASGQEFVNARLGAIAAGAAQVRLQMDVSQLVQEARSAAVRLRMARN